MKFIYWLTDSNSLELCKSCLVIFFIVAALLSVCVAASLWLLSDML